MFIRRYGKRIPVIDDSNYGQWSQLANPEDASCGLEPRDWDKHPYGSIPGAPSMSIPVMGRDEIIERTKEIEKHESGVSDVCWRRGVRTSYQNGVPYCWVFGTTKSVEMARVMAGMKHVQLSPASVGCLVTGYRSRGGWCGEALQEFIETGAAEEKDWPQYAIDRRYDNETTRSQRDNYKVIEWTDIVENNGRRPADALMKQCTMLLHGFAYAAARMWWRHATCDAQPVVLGRNSIGIITWNSHNKTGDNLVVIEESKAACDEALAPRVATATEG